MRKFTIEDMKLTLKHAHENQEEEAIPVSEQKPVPKDWYCAYVLFNLEAAYEEGHAILALGPVNGPLETYSFYRHGNALKAPGLMACLEKPVTFEDIRKASGWIQHGNPGNYWNEHVNAAFAMAFPRETYGPIRAYAEEKKAHPDAYNLVTFNCLHFVADALAAGGVAVRTYSGRALHTIIPKDAFKDAKGVTGDEAVRLQAWKYWFPLGEPPHNGLRTIPDRP